MKLKLLSALIMFCGLVTAEKPFVEWAKIVENNDSNYMIFGR